MNDNDSAAEYPDRPPRSTAQLGTIGTWPSAISALQHRDFRLFWSGQLVSLIGTWMQNAAQGWLVLVLATREYGPANTALYVGLISALGSLPVFFVTLFAGVLSDRRDRRRILLITQTCFMILSIGLAVLTGAGLVRLWQVALFTVLSGLVMAFDMPTRQAFVKDVATPAHLLNAIALNSAIFNLARIVGPAVAGRLINVPSIGVAGALYLNAASFLAVIVSLFFIKYRKPPTEPMNATVWQHLVEGFRYVICHPTVRLLMVMMAVYSIFGFSYPVLMSVIAVQVLGKNAAGFGMLMASTGIGAFIGAVFLAATAGKVRKGQVLLWGGIISGVGLIAFGMSHSYPLSLALLPFVGGGLVVTSSGINSIIQELAPDKLRGRVVSMWAFIFAGFTPIGALYAGSVAHATTPGTAILIGGVVILLMIIGVSIKRGWLWRIE